MFNQDEQNFSNINIFVILKLDLCYTLHLNFSVHGSKTGIKRIFSDIEGQKLEK